MANKEEMLSYIDKSIDSLKEDLKKYIDDSIGENEKINNFYEKFISDKFFENKEALYNINSNEIKLADIVFGIVYGDDIEDERYPFKVIYKDNEKLILEGTKNIVKAYTFIQACSLKWDIKLMANQKIIFKKDCTIISKEIIDEFNLDSLLSGQILGAGFWRWTSTTYSIERSYALCVDSRGGAYAYDMSASLGAVPFVIVYL